MITLGMEFAAVVLALVYVVLAIRENRLCWLAALASACLYSVVFWQAALLMESALQVFYAVMAIYGWIQWGANRSDNTLSITRWTAGYHWRAVVLIVVVSALLGTVLHYHTHAALPWLDSLTTVAALVATWMVTRKVLENWLYWIVIDGLSVYLYLARDLQLTAMLFVGYMVLAYAGWQTWRQLLRQQQAQTSVDPQQVHS